MELKLRYYQEAAVAKTWSWIRNNPNKNPLIVLPTGAGKTVVIAKMIADCLAWGKPAILATHNRELLLQAESTLQRMGINDVGLFGAGLGRSDTGNRVVLAQIQSAYGKPEAFGHRAAIFIDEAHRVNPTDGDTMYQRFLGGYNVNTECRIIGLTATPYRLGAGLIYGDESIFHEVSYEVSVRELIDAGFLSKLISKAPKCSIDTSRLIKRNGEFTEQSQQEAFASVADVISADFIAKTDDRRSVLIFCAGVCQAYQVNSKLISMGLSSTIITGESSTEDRDEAVSLFKAGHIKYLINVSVLTEGFDAPNVDAVIMLRATTSPGLYYQIVGRGLRLNQGKKDCLIIDYGTNILRHGPIDCIRPPRQSSGSKIAREPAYKTCENCEEVIDTRLKSCPVCDTIFEDVAESKSPWDKLSSSSENTPVLSEPEWVPILSCRAWAHRKKNASDTDKKTLAVGYYTMPNHSGFPHATQYLCVEHLGFAREKAFRWWAKLGMVEPMPNDAKAAADLLNERFLDGTVNIPTAIMTRPSEYNAAYPEVVDFSWDEKFIAFAEMEREAFLDSFSTEAVEKPTVKQNELMFD